MGGTSTSCWVGLRLLTRTRLYAGCLCIFLGYNSSCTSCLGLLKRKEVKVATMYEFLEENKCYLWFISISSLHFMSFTWRSFENINIFL
jgi:hypothetical protein